MELPNFPTCHSHPASFDSGSTPDAMAAREVALGTGAICMTDHGTLGAARHVYKLAKKNKLRPILGLEAYVRDDDCPVLARFGITKQRPPKPDNYKGTQADWEREVPETVAHYQKYFHLTMHALDQEGYEAMVRHLSAADARAEQHGQERKAIFTWQDVEALGGHNITFGSSCLIGMVQRHLLDNRADTAEAYYDRLRSMAKPGNFHVEIFPHRCDKNWVKAIFLTLEAEMDQRRVHFNKWLRVDIKGEAVVELRAHELAARFTKWLAKATRALPEVRLLAIKHYQTWADEKDPRLVLAADAYQDFLPNECGPFAPDGDVQIGANRFIMEMAKKYGDPILVSDDSHFATPDEKDVQDVRLLSMESEKTKGATPNWRFYGSYHRQTSAEALAYFKQHMDIDEGEFRSWVDNSIAWSKRFGWSFKDRKELPAKFYPQDTMAHTKGLIAKVGRMDWSNKEQRDRLAAELRMLKYNGVLDLLPYFHLAHEALAVYEERGMLTGPGRGSAAGLFLAYLLGITHVDPLKYKLSKERFLTESRIRSGKLPDIDMDLPDQSVLTDPEKGWLKQRFGDHYARISTNSMLRLRSSIQDVHRVRYGRVDPEVFNLTKKFKMPPQGISDRDFVFGYKDPTTKERVPGSIESDPALQEYTRKYPNEWALAQKAMGLWRQKGRHASAYVITNEPVSNFIPTTLVGGERCTQYDMNGVEEAGGIKMDFLGLNTLKDIQGCIKLIQQRAGYTPKDERLNGRRVPGIRVVPHLQNDGKLDLYDVWDLPEDQDVFRDVSQGRTETVFQFNTPAARQWLRLFNAGGEHTIRSIEDMSAFTALDRPGPLNAVVEEAGTKRNLLEEFAARAKGESPIGGNAVLDQMLPETYGVLVYQEQVQAAFHAIAKTTPEQADEFRVHVSKKKAEDILKDRAVFMPGAVETIGPEEAERIWSMLVEFGGYGFNKSHSVCYSIIGYAGAWLKNKYPLEWWTSVLQNADREKIDQTFWTYCQKYILVPDVKMSQDDFCIEGEHIRAPLRLLNGVGPAAHQELTELRPVTDLRDFCQKIYDRRVRLGTPYKEEKTFKRGANKGQTVMVEKVKLARSNLNKSILAKLIVSGVADSLFPPECQDVYSKLSLFREVYTETNKKKADKKDRTFDERFVSVTPLQRFLLKKSILPSYAANLADLVAAAGREDFKAEGLRYGWKLPRPFENNRWAPVVRGPLLRRVIEGSAPVTPKFKLGAVAYVSNVEWFWNNKACRVHFEVDGERFTFVKWPRRDQDDDGNTVQIAPLLPKDLVGSVAIVTMVRFNADRDFNLDDIVVVEPPFDIKASEESAE